jgi:Prolyl oligopeptidase family
VGGALDTGVDDVGFIAALIDWAATERNIDRSRVCVTGISNGGTMTERLVIERPDLFAAAAAFVTNLPERDIPFPSVGTPFFLLSGTNYLRSIQRGTQYERSRRGALGGSHARFLCGRRSCGSRDGGDVAAGLGSDGRLLHSFAVFPTQYNSVTILSHGRWRAPVTDAAGIASGGKILSG